MASLDYYAIEELFTASRHPIQKRWIERLVLGACRAVAQAKEKRLTHSGFALDIGSW